MEKDYTIEELKAMLATKEKEEADRKRKEYEEKTKKLKAEKDARYKDMMEKIEIAADTFRKYINDYKEPVEFSATLPKIFDYLLRY